MSEDYTFEESVGTGGEKKNNTVLIIVIIAAVLLLCCCCVAAAAGIWYASEEGLVQALPFLLAA